MREERRQKVGRRLLFHERRHKRFKTQKNIFSKIFIIAFFVPVSIVFLTNLEGRNIKEAVRFSLSLMIDPGTAPVIWILIFLINLLLFLFEKPIFAYSADCKRKGCCSPDLRKKAVKRFNNLGPFTLISVTLGFALGASFEHLIFRFFDPGSTAQTFLPLFDLLESVSVGLFTGTLIYLTLDNLLFSVKQEIFREEAVDQQKYSSFYRKIFLMIGVLLFFLVFQVFESLSNVYFIGLQKTLSLEESSGKDIHQIADEVIRINQFLNQSRENDLLKSAMKLMIFKMFFFTGYIMLLLRQIKLALTNPLSIVHDKLEDLNSDSTEMSNRIDIINNDEFTPIYNEINKLIEKQNRDLEHSREQLSLIVENAGDPIVSFLEDGTIVVFNPAAEEFFGYAHNEVVSTPIVRLIDLPEEIDEACKDDPSAFVRYIREKQSVLKRFSGLRKDGTKNFFEANVKSSSTDRGLLYTAVLRDIAKQMEFEETLTEAKVSAENANRMKSEFLANMSHELRTPLNAVLGFTQILSIDKNLTDGQKDKILTISRSGEHLLALINDILDISKIESGKTEMHDTVFDLERFIADLKDMFILRCRTKGLSFYVENDGELPRYVEGDLGKLRQIMINLIGNSVKFTNEGGISLLAGWGEGKIRFAIKDTGKGIPEDELEKIVKPFMQSSNTDNEGGTGLGLAITSSFIEMMGGQLRIESKLGEGSIFSFEVPLKISETAPEEDKKIGTVLSVKNQRPVKVLIVDDKVDNRIILKSMLENVGFITMEAENGVEAIERTKEFTPEIIFMDIKMPVMDGYEAVGKIKATEEGKKILIIALTASAFKHDEKRIYQSGFDGFMAKPFKMDRLFSLISEKTDIEFNYEDEQPAAADELPQQEELDYKVIARNISEEELEKLSDDIMINDFTAVRELLDKISTRPELKEVIVLMNYYAKNFDEIKLDEILKEIRGNKNG